MLESAHSMETEMPYHRQRVDEVTVDRVERPSVVIGGSTDRGEVDRLEARDNGNQRQSQSKVTKPLVSLLKARTNDQLRLRAESQRPIHRPRYPEHD